MVHFDSHGEPCLPTAEAMRILLYPHEAPGNGNAQQMFSQQVRALFPAGPLAKETAPEGEFISGRRRYVYRIYALAGTTGGGSELVAVMIFKRRDTELAPVADSLTAFHLTAREKEVLGCVLQGFSNKEIAASMGISPNTVKTFMRLIQTKLRVSSRLGILAKVTGQAPSLHRPRRRRPAALPMARLPVVRHS